MENLASSEQNENSDPCIYELQEKLDNLIKESSKRDEIIRQLRIGLDKEKRIHDLDKCLDTIEDKTEISLFQLKINSLQTQLIDQSNDNEQYKLKIMSLMNELMNKDQLNSKQNEILTKINHDVDFMMKFKERTKLIIDENIKYIDSLLKKITDLQNQISLKNKDIDIFRTESHNQTLEILQLKSHLDEIEKEIQDILPNQGTINKLPERIKLLVLENESMKNQLEIYKSQVSSFICDKKWSTHTIVRLKKELEGLNEINSNLKNKLNYKNEKSLEFEKNDIDLKQQIECLNEKLDQLNNALSKALEEDVTKSELIKTMIKDGAKGKLLLNNVEKFKSVVERSHLYLQTKPSKCKELRDFKCALQIAEKVLMQLSEYDELN